MHRKANVLLIENSTGFSGSTFSLYSLVANLGDEEFHPFVIFSRPEQLTYFRRQFASTAEAAVIQCRAQTKTTAIAESIGKRAGRLHPLIAKVVYGVFSVVDLCTVFGPYVLRMARFARGRDIDLIHQNNGFDLSAVLLALLMRKPLLAYQRGAEWNSALVRFMARFVDHYIANSEQTRRDLREIGVPQEKITVITPPVDLTKFDHTLDCAKQRREFGLSDSDLCFGILGSLMEWKGQRVFLKAARRVMERIPKAKAFIVGQLPGGANPGYERELRELAVSLGIGDRVVFTGFREDTPEMIQIQHVIVHASLTPEPFGRVIIEAMAMRKPVIASKAGGPLEIIDDGINGFLFPPGDDAELADKIVLLLANPELADRLGHEAFLMTRRCHTIEPHVEAVSRVYRSMLRDTGRSQKESFGERGASTSQDDRAARQDPGVGG